MKPQKILTKKVITAGILSLGILLLWRGMYWACHDPHTFRPVGLLAAFMSFPAVLWALHTWEKPPNKKNGSP